MTTALLLAAGGILLILGGLVTLWPARKPAEITDQETSYTFGLEPQGDQPDHAVVEETRTTVVEPAPDTATASPAATGRFMTTAPAPIGDDRRPE